MKVTVTVTPVSGKPVNKDVEANEGATVAEILQAADCGTQGFNLFVNGEPAQPNTKVDGAVKVTATEKVAGS